MLAMMGPRGRRVLAVLVGMLAAACTWVWARSTATVPPAPTPILTVDANRPGSPFDLGAVGLSVDANELGTDHLSANDRGLVRLMRLLGPSVLRIGGSSVDLSWWTSSGESPPPWATNTVTPADLAVVRGLLHATGWQVLLGVDLGHFEPARVANETRVAQQLLGTKLLGVEIGNEPNAYSDKNRKVIVRPPTYGVSEYLHEAEAYRQALTAAAPGIAVYGPALSQTRWLTEMGASASMFTEITQHYYPTDTCLGALSPGTIAQPTPAELLSPVVRDQEDETLKALAQVGALSDRPTRIGETGSAACTGNAAASPVFASALWSLDWTLRAASNGVKGLNFHGHLGVCGSYTQSPICAPSAEAAKAGDVTAQPEYYGLLAASRLEGGRFLPTSLNSSNQLPDLTTWATLAPGGAITITIDNLATAGLAQPVSIPMPGYTATEEQLVGPSVEARSGLTFGAAPVTGKGQWRPRPARLPHRGGSFRIVVRPASAVVITLHRHRSHG
jgi:hypothetical protein